MRAIVLVSTVQNPEEPLHCDAKGLVREPENEIINDFDLIAVEAAVQLKEAGALDEVVVFSLAPEKTHLQKVLAMGADRAVWGCAQNAELTPDIVAHNAIKTFGDLPQLWLTGKLGVNFESHLTAQRIAARLGCPCLSSVYRIQCVDGAWKILCEEDSGISEYRTTMPCVLTADLRLATPRFPSLPNIVRAKKKRSEMIAVDFEDVPERNVRNGVERRRQCTMVSHESSMIELIKGAF